MREWAYGWTYQHSGHRTHALASWQHHYNWHRPHSGIGGAVPVFRLTWSAHDLLTAHTSHELVSWETGPGLSGQALPSLMV